MKRRSHTGLRRRSPRRGMSLLLVLGLVAIALAVSYALLRTQIAAVQLQSNADRQVSARQAALAGLAAAIRKLHAPDWAGVDVPLQANLDSNSRYEVSFETGDTALSSTSPDYSEFPFRVTVSVTGYATDPARPELQSSHRVAAVLQLVRRKMSAEPANWAQLQAYTVYQWANANVYAQVPVRVQGPVMLQGTVQLCNDYPEYDAARIEYLEDLEQQRAAGLGDNRPFDGPITTSFSQNAGTIHLLRDSLNLTVNQASVSNAQPLTPPGSVRSYRLFPGGKLYTVPTIQAQYGGTLANRTLAANPSTNPLGLFPSDGSLTINDNVTIEGTLVTGGAAPDVQLYGNNVVIRGRDLPRLYQSNTRTQLPAALVRDDFRVRDQAQGSLTGLAVVWDEFEYREGDAAMAFDFKGRLITGKLLLNGRDSWDFGSLWWQLLLGLFNTQRTKPSPILYFPQWLQANSGLQTKPLLTIGPDSSGVAYHWQDWSQPVYVAHPDDGGLRWDLVRWKDNP